MNIEFSFTAFDDFPALKDSKSKYVLQNIADHMRNKGYSVVYSCLIKMAALDAGVSTKNIHRGLADRIATFPNKRQVIIHMFDNLSNQEYFIQDRARNEASFTTDIRNYRPRKEPINKASPISHTLSTSLNAEYLKSKLTSYPLQLLDHEKLYLDNFIYYSSLLRSANSGAIPLLVYIPHNLGDLQQATNFILELCKEIAINLN